MAAAVNNSPPRGGRGMSVRVRIVTLIESIMRTRALPSSCAAMLLAMGGCAPSSDDPRTEFDTDVAIDGIERVVTRTLQPGAYLIEAHESDIDVRLVIDGPGVHSEAADEVPRHGALH